MIQRNDFCIVVNTTSKSSDIWEMFVGQLEKYFPKQKVYIFTDESSRIFSNYNVILYNKNSDYRTQYYECIKQVTEPLCLNMNDDYILYDAVNHKQLNAFIDFLKQDARISFIRAAKGYNATNYEYTDNLYHLDINTDFFFSQTVAIWNTRTLEKIHELSPNSGIGRKQYELQLETEANSVCKSLNLYGLYYYDNEPKRGLYHYDSNIFPYIASALVGGKWNIREYSKELTPLFIEYNIDMNKRGTF